MFKKNNQICFDNIEETELNLPNEFTTTFPLLADLLHRAKVIDFVINGNQRFRQYIWFTPAGNMLGWLCQLEHLIPAEIKFLKEHLLLAKNMGGIIEHWGNEDESTLLDAKLFNFSLKESTQGINEWEEHYLERCKEREIIPRDTSKFVTFSLESNGVPTFYDIENQQVYSYLFNGYSELRSRPINGHPDYTIYEYQDIKTFNEYIEYLAKEWLSLIEE